MSYITTFDAAFWTSVIMAVAIYCYQYFLSDHYVRTVVKFITKHNTPKLGILYLVVGFATVALWFFLSVKGTTTAMFWATLSTLIFYPLVRKINIAIMEKNFASLEKLGL